MLGASIEWRSFHWPWVTPNYHKLPHFRHFVSPFIIPLAFCSNHVTILRRSWDMTRYLLKIAILTYPTCIRRSRWCIINLSGVWLTKYFPAWTDLIKCLDVVSSRNIQRMQYISGNITYCCTTVQEIPLENACNRWITLKVTRGHRDCRYSIGHIHASLPISGL